jgi:hypothetical protein
MNLNGISKFHLNVFIFEGIFLIKNLFFVPIAIGIHLREIKASAFMLGFSFYRWQQFT